MTKVKSFIIWWIGDKTKESMTCALRLIKKGFEATH